MIPILGYMSYILLILSELYRQKKYAHHIEAHVEEVYGPMLPAIRAKKWFNVPILFSWIVIGGVLVLCSWYRESIQFYLQFNCFDFLVGLYLMMILLGIESSLWHLLVYKYAAEEPSSLSGKATLSSRLVMHQLAYQMLAITLLLVGLTAYQPTTFLMGALFASLVVSVKCLINARKKK